MRDWLKSLEKLEKRIVSGVEKLDIVRFIMELNYEEKVQIHELKNKESA